MLDSEYHSSLQGLCRHGFVKRVNENQFLITPKGRAKVRTFWIEKTDWTKKEWDKNWRIVSFDIPEKKRRARDILRSLLQRKGFIGLQNSVFIAPFADFEALAQLRENLNIAKYVSFFVAKSYKTDDDSELRKKFNL